MRGPPTTAPARPPPPPPRKQPRRPSITAGGGCKGPLISIFSRGEKRPEGMGRGGASKRNPSPAGRGLGEGPPDNRPRPTHTATPREPPRRPRSPPAADARAPHLNLLPRGEEARPYPTTPLINEPPTKPPPPFTPVPNLFKTNSQTGFDQSSPYPCISRASYATLM